MATSIKTKKTRLSPKKKGVTYVALVIDSSGSMSVLADEVKKYYTQFVKDLKETSKANNQQTFVCVYSFSNYVTNLTGGFIPLDEIEDLNYNVDNMTALLDGIGQALTDMDDLPHNKNTGHAIVVLTDGQENYSKNFNATLIKQAIELRLKEGDLTLAVQVPMNGRDAAIKYGIISDCVREWKVGKEGMTQNIASNTAALQGYMGTRGAGGQSVSNFYDASVDLNSLKPTDLKRNLDDVSHKFKEYQVEKEVDIKTFYEEKTKKEYLPGTTFFMLTKKEKVQITKEILLMEKGKKQIFGGDAVRNLIGIPDGKNLKLDPLNTGFYKVFVESTSLNRKLVRGTSVLIRK